MGRIQTLLSMIEPFIHQQQSTIQPVYDSCVLANGRLNLGSGGITVVLASPSALCAMRIDAGKIGKVEYANNISYLSFYGFLTLWFLMRDTGL